MLDCLHLQLSSQPDTEDTEGVSYPFPAAPSCGIWAAKVSPLKTLIQRQGRREGMLGRQGHLAAQHPSWQARARLFLIQDVLQQLKMPALPSFPWALISELTTVTGLTQICQPPPLCLQRARDLGPCVCVFPSFFFF